MAGAITRQVSAIVGRAVCLCVVASKAEGLEPQAVASLIGHFQVGRYLRPPEARFLFDDEPVSAEAARILQWGFEACHALLWSVHKVEALGDPVSTCDPRRLAQILTTAGTMEALAAGSRLRRAAEVLDAADFTARGLAVCARLSPPYSNAPGGLVCPVVLQRAYAFSWLTDPARPKWEDVPARVHKRHAKKRGAK